PHARPLHSFPTRRSSDLSRLAWAESSESWATGTPAFALRCDVLALSRPVIALITAVWSAAFAPGGWEVSSLRAAMLAPERGMSADRKSTRLNSSHLGISY